MKIRITKKSIRKYQVGGEPKQEDYPDYGSYMSAYKNWLSTGAAGPAMNATPDSQQAVTNVPVLPLVQSNTPGILPKNIGPVFQLNGNQQPNYAWTNFGQAPTVPMPKRTVVQPDGTKVTTGDFGTPTVLYAIGNNQGTPVTNSAPKPPKKSAYAKGYDFIMNPMRSLQKGLQKPFMQDIYGAASVINGITDLALPIATFFDNKQKIKDARINAEINRYNSYNSSPKFRGNWTINEGLFRPDDRGVNEGMFGNNFFGPTMAMFGGSMLKDTTTDTPMKIRIKSIPSMEYGGQSNFGLDLGRRKVYTDMPETKSESVSSTISKVPRHFANIEAEGGETVFGDLDQDGMMEHMKIQGKRHTQGGVPLNVPEGSFVFSDTKKMKIKDPQILSQFGVTYKSGGITPAKIAKKFELNKYKAILEDPTSDPIAKKTAEMMIKNNSEKLANLAMVQESMKGFPQGQPAVAQAIMGTPEMAYGGYYLPEFQGTGNSQVGPQLGEWSDDYDALQKLLMSTENAELRKAMYNEFLKNYPKSPLKSDPKGEEKFIQNFLNAQQQFMAIGEKYKDKPEILKSRDWDRGGRNVYYNKIAKDMGLTPMSEPESQRFQAGYRALAQAIQKNPKFIESFGQYFDLTPEGVDDQTFLNWPISGADSWVGNTTIGQKARLRKPLPEPQSVPEFICDTATGKAVPVPAGTPGAYKTADEALKNCPQKPQEKPKYLCIDGKPVESAYGYDTPDEAMKHCGKTSGEIPFDFILPDKMNIGWRAAMAVPEIIMPTKYNLPSRTYPVAFDDWMARAQNRQAVYNTAMDTARDTNQSQAVGSFLAGLVGSQDVSDIADVNSRNVDRADRKTMMDAEMDFKRDLQSYLGNMEYDKGVATARQQYRNALDAGVTNFIDAYGRGWLRRGDIYDRNRRSKYFYRDPNTWKTVFKGNPADILTNPEFAGGSGSFDGSASGYGSLGANFNALYNQYLNQLKASDLKPEEQKAQAIKLANMAVSSSAQRNTSMYDQLGMPRARSVRSTYYPGIDDDDMYGYSGMFGW